jgi:hypothetical protein
MVYPQPAVRVMRDGREICDKMTTAGRKEYRRRTLAMLYRQEGRCCLEAYAPGCPGTLTADSATFDHEWGRGQGGGKRDDRIVLPDGTWLNGACHNECNQWKGSRYVAYQRAIQRGL